MNTFGDDEATVIRQINEEKQTERHVYFGKEDTSCVNSQRNEKVFGDAWNSIYIWNILENMGLEK